MEAMRPCSSCGHPVSNNAKECPECGQREEEPKKAPASPVKHEEKADSVERRMLIGFIAALFLIPLAILVPLFGIEGLIVALAIPFLAIGFWVAGGLH